MDEHLSNHHRDTLAKLFSHPPSGNVEWREIVSLFEAIGSATEEHNGKLKITLGSVTDTIPVPHSKDVDEQTIVDLRRMLRAAGFGPAED